MASDHTATTAAPVTDRSPATTAPVNDRSKHGRMGPHSRMLLKGTVNGNTREGRYLAHCEHLLAQHVAPGGQPTIAQRLLIRRVSRAMLRLELLDEKKRLTDYDLRLGNALDNRVRLGLKALGLKSGAAKPGPTLQEYLRSTEVA